VVTVLTDAAIEQMADELARVPGVVGVVLGGSRSRGTHLPTSDVDLGIYYSDGLDLDALRALAARCSTSPVEIGSPGSWGPWVDAGGWLTVDGTPVDWILRDLARVRKQWDRAQRGRYRFHAQAGHPLGFLDVSYAGEVASGRVLADPTGVLAPLRQQTLTYPPALADALISALWEAPFLVGCARKGIKRLDTAYVAICLARALMLTAHGFHARAGVWAINEKDLIPNVARLDLDSRGFSRRAADALSRLGTSEFLLARAIDAVADVVDDSAELIR
jgi:predicted nucleotidyltransferase